MKDDILIGELYKSVKHLNFMYLLFKIQLQCCLHSLICDLSLYNQYCLEIGENYYNIILKSAIYLKFAFLKKKVLILFFNSELKA